jgi:hypothetical protein
MEDIELFSSLWAFDQLMLDGNKRIGMDEIPFKPMPKPPAKWDYFDVTPSEPAIRFKASDE